MCLLEQIQSIKLSIFSVFKKLFLDDCSNRARKLERVVLKILYSEKHFLVRTLSQEGIAESSISAIQFGRVRSTVNSIAKTNCKKKLFCNPFVQ